MRHGTHSPVSCTGCWARASGSPEHWGIFLSPGMSRLKKRLLSPAFTREAGAAIASWVAGGPGTAEACSFLRESRNGIVRLCGRSGPYIFPTMFAFLIVSSKASRRYAYVLSSTRGNLRDHCRFTSNFRVGLDYPCPNSGDTVPGEKNLRRISGYEAGGIRPSRNIYPASPKVSGPSCLPC
jgi:hypothetical protein